MTMVKMVMVMVRVWQPSLHYDIRDSIAMMVMVVMVNDAMMGNVDIMITRNEKCNGHSYHLHVLSH